MDDRRHPAGALRGAAVVFAIGSVLHNADHFRRGAGSITTQL